MILINTSGIVSENIKFVKVYPERLSGILTIGENTIFIHDVSQFEGLDSIKGKEVNAKVNPCSIFITTSQGKEEVCFALESYSSLGN